MAFQTPKHFQKTKNKKLASQKNLFSLPTSAGGVLEECDAFVLRPRGVGAARERRFLDVGCRQVVISSGVAKQRGFFLAKN